MYIGIQKALQVQGLEDLQQLQGTSKRLSKADEKNLFLPIIN